MVTFLNGKPKSRNSRPTIQEIMKKTKGHEAGKAPVAENRTS